MFLFKSYKTEVRIETIKIGEVALPVKIYFENRKNSRVSISRKSVNIRIPYFLTAKQKAIEEARLKAWAIEHIKQISHKLKRTPIRNYKHNDIIKVGEKEYILKIKYKKKKSSSGRLRNKNEIHLSLAGNLSKTRQNWHISRLLGKIIGNERLPSLRERVDTLNREHFHVRIKKISFRNQKSRWGSCSSKGNINISTRLLFAPDDVLEYVCIHELAHLKEMNHSRRFWNLVAEAMPDYKDKKKWLKEKGDQLDF